MTTELLLEKDVSQLVDIRKGFSYLPWATAWKMVLEIDDKAILKVDRNPVDGLQCFGNPEMGYTVYTTLTFQDVSRDMYLPVFEGKKSIKKPTTFDINTAVQRCSVKNIAVFGLGLNVYIGEDIPPQEPLVKTEPIEIEPIEIELEPAMEWVDKNGNITNDPFEAVNIEKKIFDESGNPLDEEGNLIDESEDILDKDNKKSIDLIKKVEPVISELDQKFISVMTEQKFSEKKQKGILENEFITDTIKKGFIANPKKVKL